MAKKDYKNIELDAKYVPKMNEEYMNDNQRAYFYQLLMAQKAEAEADETEPLSEFRDVGDESDRASGEQDVAFNLKMSERTQNLIRKINASLERLEKGTYGFSVLSGDEIGLKRMLARPLATLTIEEQEDQERSEV